MEDRFHFAAPGVSAAYAPTQLHAPPTFEPLKGLLHSVYIHRVASHKMTQVVPPSSSRQNNISEYE